MAYPNTTTIINTEGKIISSNIHHPDITRPHPHSHPFRDIAFQHRRLSQLLRSPYSDPNHRQHRYALAHHRPIQKARSKSRNRKDSRR
jgi:hypothetical protein